MRRIRRIDGATPTHPGLAGIARMRQPPKLKQTLIPDGLHSMRRNVLQPAVNAG
jgi:hypothetical protein